MKKVITTVLLTLCALITLYYAFRHISPEITRMRLGQINRFDYFTIQTNIFTGIWLLLLAISQLTPNSITTKLTNQTLALAVTSYITVTGVVYWAVLSPMFGLNLSLSNLWQHGFITLIAWLAFIFLLPPRKREGINLYRLLIIITYPIAYMIFAFIRGNSTGKALYPFLSPRFMGGIWGAIISVILITCFFLLIAYLLRKIKIKKLL